MRSAETVTRDRLAASWRSLAAFLAALERHPARASRVVWLSWALTRLLLLVGLLLGKSYCDPWFYHYAGELADGHWPYRDVPVEYPPLALLLILLPALPLLPFSAVAPRPDAAFLDLSHLPQPDPTRYAPYGVSFALEMLLLDALTLWLVRRAGRRLVPNDPLGVRSALVYVVLIFACGALLQKFDLVAGTCCLLALLALVEDHPALAGAGLAAAALVKGFPALALPVFLLYYLARSQRHTLYEAAWSQARPLSRCLGAFVIVVGGATALVVIGASLGRGLPHGIGAVWHTLTYHTGRGLEIESIWANVLLALGWLPGARPWTAFSGEDLSRVVHSPLEGAVARLATPTLAVAILLTSVVAYRAIVRARDVRRDPSDDAQLAVAATLAVLLAFMLTFRALPAHYLLVVTPLGSVVRLPRVQWTKWWWASLVGVAVLGQLLTPASIWESLKAFQPWAVAVLSVRNCSWLLAFAVLISALWMSRRQPIES